MIKDWCEAFHNKRKASGGICTLELSKAFLDNVTTNFIKSVALGALVTTPDVKT